MDDERDTLNAWLTPLELPIGTSVAGWRLESVGAGRGGPGLRLAFVQDGATVEVVLEPSSKARKCYARTRDVDISHSPMPEALMGSVTALMKQVVVRIQRDGSSPLVLPDIGRDQPRQAYAGAYASAAIEPELDPALRAPDDDPFLRIETLDVQELARFPDALREMYAGDRGGLLIRNVYPKPEMQLVVERLEGRHLQFPETAFPERFKASFFGRCLDGSDPELTAYLTDAERFRIQTRAAFEGIADFEARMEQVFAMVAGGRRVELPRFADGRAYTPATIRILPEGGQIGTHCGNEAATREAYTHLNSLVDRHDQISYFLTLQAPESGGELIVYSLRWSDIDVSHFRDGHTLVDDLLTRARWTAVSPQAGDVILFDGGRYFHRVAVVKGARTRWTIGGFLMFSLDASTVYYWS